MLLSPLNTKLTCCPLVLLPREPLLELLDELEPEEDGRKSIHGTATCLPLEEDKLLPELLDNPEELEPPGLLLPPELLLEDPELPELSPLEEPLDPVPEDEPLGLVLAPELLLEFSDRIAKSILPEFGLMMVSLIVPSVSPEEPVTLAPMSWLARNSWWPMRPVAPQCRELPD